MGTKFNRHIDARKPKKNADGQNKDHLMDKNLMETSTENLICLMNNIEVQHQMIFKSTTLKGNYGDNLCTGVVLGDVQRDYGK